MNQSQHETKEEIKDTISNHQPDTMERQLEQWMDEADRKPTECTWTKESAKGKTNKQESEIMRTNEAAAKSRKCRKNGNKKSRRTASSWEKQNDEKSFQNSTNQMN